MGQKRVRALTFRALGCVLIALCSWIHIPTPVPFTLQTFAVFLLCDFLGGWGAAVSVAVYLLLGAAGLPVFSGFSGGAAHIIGPTGGYLFGFVLSAVTCVAGEKWAKGSFKKRFFLLFAALLVCYACGSAYFMIYTKGAKTLSAVLTLCVLPYILPDAVKIFLALKVSDRLHAALRE